MSVFYDRCQNHDVGFELQRIYEETTHGQIPPETDDSTVGKHLYSRINRDASKFYKKRTQAISVTCLVSPRKQSHNDCGAGHKR